MQAFAIGKNNTIAVEPVFELHRGTALCLPLNKMIRNQIIIAYILTIRNNTCTMKITGGEACAKKEEGNCFPWIYSCS